MFDCRALARGREASQRTRIGPLPAWEGGANNPDRKPRQDNESAVHSISLEQSCRLDSDLKLDRACFSLRRATRVLPQRPATSSIEVRSKQLCPEQYEAHASSAIAAKETLQDHRNRSPTASRHADACCQLASTLRTLTSSTQHKEQVRQDICSITYGRFRRALDEFHDLNSRQTICSRFTNEAWEA